MDVTTPSTPPQGGFGHSPRRVAIEIGLVILGLVVLVFGSFRVASCMAGTLVRHVPVSADEALGEGAWDELTPAGQRCTDPATLAYVDALTGPLVAALGESGFTFRFAVADSDEVNAFALPGGFVTINRGLIEKALSGEEIAGVIAHEIHHVTLRHGLTRVVRAAGGRVLLGLILGWSDVGTLAQYAGRLVDLSYDRDQERAADREGRALLMKAGIDPGGMGRFFGRLQAEAGAGGGVADLLSTHPNHAERVRAAEEDARSFSPTVTLPAPPAELRCR
jgi:beta-barrel assembly-enhancing protease